MSSPPVTHLRISRTGWIVLGLLFVIPWVGVVWFARAPHHPGSGTPVPVAPVAPAQASKPSTETLPAGPWGRLEYSRIVIEPPEDYVPIENTAPESLRWVFRGYTPEKLAALWQRAALTPEQQRALTAPAGRHVDGEAIILKPDREAVIGLRAEARATIYAALAEFPENSAQRDPFRLRTDAAADWFDDSGISAPILALTQRLLYTRNGNTMFSDSDVVLPKIESVTERVRFIKTLARKSTMLVQLVVEHDTDVEAVARYWGRGHRSKDVLPLLQSLARRPGGGVVDIAHLMPPFPRSLLYTYPLASGRLNSAAHDCHWTSFNFGLDRPDERFLKIDFVKQTLDEDYYAVAGPPALGDVIALVRPDGTVVHSCVYVAAGVVFTKNGASYSVPWLLGNLDSVVAFYSVNGSLELHRFRRREQ